MKLFTALKVSLPLAVALAVSPATHAFNLGSLFDGKDTEANKAAVTAAAEAVTSVQQASATTGSALADGLVGALSEQLGVSKTQAIGGLTALVGYASNNLPAEYGNQIKELFPSMSSGSSGGNLLGGLMGNFSNMGSVDKAFNGLGMETDMVDQFTPVIESYLGSQGVSSELVSALGQLW